MATLTRRMEDVEERTDSLGTIFAAFMARTDEAMARTDERIGRLERVVERMGQNIERREQEGARETSARVWPAFSKTWISWRFKKVTMEPSTTWVDCHRQCRLNLREVDGGKPSATAGMGV